MLGDQSSSARKAALSVLRKEDRARAKSFAREGRWCRVTLTGSAEPLGSRLLGATFDAAQQHWDGRKGRKPRVLKELEEACGRADVTTSEILALVSSLQEALAKTGSGGLLFVIDELGKFLEFEARHYGANDIFLLQKPRVLAYEQIGDLLADVLTSFDLYARGLGESLKNDWAKVQGRFQNVPFLESTEQTLRVVDAAISQKLTSPQCDGIRRDAQRIAAKLNEAGALPGMLDTDQAAELFAGCYPLHPVALLALPSLCQKYAQNERTLFSYLGSQEPHGLQSWLAENVEVGAWVHPSAVFDYFIQNQPAILADPLAHRRWAEVVTAVERAQQLPEEARQLSKSIGLLNLVSGNEGLRASLPVLASLYSTESKCKKGLKALASASVVQFRRFSNEYRVWQGTDFDLDEHVEQERQKLGKFDLAPKLAERTSIEPVLARRHSIQYGLVRYFEVEFYDARSYVRYSPAESAPRIVVFLAEGQEDERLFHAKLQPALSDNDLVALYKNGGEIRACIEEVLALEGVQRGAQELASDPVAARELKERLNAALLSEWRVAQTIVGSPARSEWFWRDQKLEVSSPRELQELASRVMDSVYSLSPIIHNEMINRDRLSSQAAAARNKLLQGMLERAAEPGLGIQKYPPERAIYRSIFEKGAMHGRQDGAWEFRAPGSACPLNLSPTWSRLDEFFASTETQRRSVVDLQEWLAEPPYGLKLGVLPILLVHYLLVNGHEIALYEEGAYVPGLSFDHVERLIRQPHTFEFQRFRIEGIRASLFSEYRKALFGDSGGAVDVLGIARPLSSFMLGLEDYTKKTRTLSRTTLGVRDAFFLSKSPEKLLLEELPKACGVDTSEDTDGFAETLLGALRELKGAYADLLDSMRQAICEAFGLAKSMSVEELRHVLRGRCHGLDQFTVDVKGLKSFIRRVCERDSDDESWIRGLLLFLGHKPSIKWHDQDRDAATYRLAEFARRLLDLEKLRLHYDGLGRRASDLDVVMIKTMRSGGRELEQIVSITDKARSATKESRRVIREALDQLGDNELRLSVVSEIAYEFLQRYHEAQLNSEMEAREEGAFDVGG